MYIHYSTGNILGPRTLVHIVGFRNKGSPFSEVPL